MGSNWHNGTVAVSLQKPILTTPELGPRCHDSGKTPRLLTEHHIRTGFLQPSSRYEEIMAGCLKVQEGIVWILDDIQ